MKKDYIAIVKNWFAPGERLIAVEAESINKALAEAIEMLDENEYIENIY